MQKMLLVIFSLLILTLVGVCGAANWQTVTTFTGASGQTTDYFTIPTTEWRIKWNITVDKEYSEYSALYVNVYPKGEDLLYISFFDGNNKQINGTEYIHEGNREYYLDIRGASLEAYTITVEYDAEAPIPEFSTIAVIIALVLASISIIAVRKGTQNQRKYSDSKR